MSMAASSTEISRTVAPSGSSMPATVLTAPKPPKSTLVSGRFMARPMRTVSNVPEAPTNAPATIRSSLFRTNPASATAIPVMEFMRAMTTGMSAPPMGVTRTIPSTSASAVIPTSRSVPVFPPPALVISAMIRPTNGKDKHATHESGPNATCERCPE